jgi:hypothetical protein
MIDHDAAVGKCSQEPAKPLAVDGATDQERAQWQSN